MHSTVTYIENASLTTKIVLLLDPVNNIQWHSSDFQKLSEYKHNTPLSYRLTMKATFCKAESPIMVEYKTLSWKCDKKIWTK
jgi:hypothetical protein